MTSKGHRSESKRSGVQFLEPSLKVRAMGVAVKRRAEEGDSHHRLDESGQGKSNVCMLRYLLTVDEYGQGKSNVCMLRYLLTVDEYGQGKINVCMLRYLLTVDEYGQGKINMCNIMYIG